MDVLARVEEPTRSDGNVGHFVPVERKRKVQVDGGRPAVTLGEHGVLLHDPVLGRVEQVEVDPGGAVIGNVHLVILVNITLRRGNVLVICTDRLIDFLLGDVNVTDDAATAAAEFLLGRRLPPLGRAR